MEPENPDIRQEVDRSRGLLKKIQLLVPLFHGYRELEDFRQADELLRKQLSDILQQTMKNLQDQRVALVNKGAFGELTNIASVLSKTQELQGDILHATQGYSGISPSIRVDADTLNSLYESDLKFLEVCQNIKNSSSGNSANMEDELSRINSEIDLAKTAWAERLEKVENILLKSGGKS
jgi:hypothetical protein